MIPGHPNGYEHPGARYVLAVAPDEVTGMPRCPESIQTKSNHESLRYEKHNLQL